MTEEEIRELAVRRLAAGLGVPERLLGHAPECESSGHRLRRWRPWWPPFAPRRVFCVLCPFEVVEPTWTDG